MDYPLILKSFSALIFVMALIGLASVLARKYGPERFLSKAMKSGLDKRLKIVETLPLDIKRKLVLISRDDKEHLVLLGAEDSLLIEQNIGTAQPQINLETKDLKNENI